MTFLDGIGVSFTRLSLRSKVGALESTFQQTLEIFRELLTEVQIIQDESDNYKTELLTQKEKCNSKNCPASEHLKKVIEIKENIIQMAASTTIRLNETQDLSIINELFKILCGEVATVTPPKDKQENKENATKANTPVSTPSKKTDVQANKVKKKLLTPKKEFNSSLDDISLKEESISEIDGTPGRTSPILSRKIKSSSSISVSGTLTDSRDKKKCPANWPTPDSKQLKVCFSPPFGKGKSRQGKLVFTLGNTTNVVDLTCSPEFSGGARNTQNTQKSQNPQMQLLIKKESSDNDDTILPSPTSGPTNIALSKTSCNKGSQGQKFRKPLPLSLVKKEKEVEDDASSPIISVVDKKPKESTNTKCEELEDSINILQPNRFQKSPYKLRPKQSPVKKESSAMKPEPVPVKLEQAQIPGQEDITRCEEASMSILQHLNKLDDNTRMDVDADGQKSPKKRPLAENRNAVNIPPVAAHESSMSVLHPEVKPEDHGKRKHIAKVEPVYKEPTVRKKAEKMNLPAWCCDECIDFFGNLYEDDPDMVKKIIGRCSKHRGRNNPARPRTPTGFWYPRWDVPEDTEEFNKRNNAS